MNHFPLRSVVVGSGCRPPRSSAALFAERHLVQLGIALALRPLTGASRPRAQQVRTCVMRLYNELHDCAEGRGAGSVLHLSLAGLVGAGLHSGHCFAYVPEPEPGERLGALVFLHGNGGNLQIFPWLWRPLAERDRLAILCPSFGFGFWGEGSAQAVERVRLDAVARFSLDPDRFYLAGLSDGGNGVTRTATAHPDRYRGLVYLSPTMRLDEISDPAFAAAWRDRPVLVIQGGQDRNVTQASVDVAVQRLKAQGSDVSYVVYPEEDHCLIFTRREDLLAVVERWLTSHAHSGCRLPY